MKIENLIKLAETLENVCGESDSITSEARHLTVNHIVVKLMGLADDNNINIDVELNNVNDCLWVSDQTRSMSVTQISSIKLVHF